MMKMYVVIAMYYPENMETDVVQQCLLGTTWSKRKANRRVKQWYEENSKLCKDCKSSETFSLYEDGSLLNAECIDKYGKVAAYVYIDFTKLL